MKDANVCIWKLTKSIEEVENLLTCTSYSKNIKAFQGYNIPQNDKSLISKWIFIDGKQPIKLSVTVGRKVLKIVKCLACVETLGFTEDELSDFVTMSNSYIPKDKVISKNYSSVIFVKSSDVSYCIVWGPKSLESRIRSTLMDQVKRSNSSWGSLEHKVVREYTYTKDFFFWLLNNKGRILTSEQEDNVKIVDVKGFRSDSAERKTSQYSGSGSNIDNEIPFKSLVCMDESLVSLYLYIYFNNRCYSFNLEYNGRIAVCKSECNLLGNQEDDKIDIEQAILDIYFEILPFLLQKYNEDCSNGLNRQLNVFKKTLAVEVIKELMTQNNIQIKELNEMVANEVATTIEK